MTLFKCLQTNRIDKEDESKILGKRGYFRVNRDTKRGECNTHKENPGNTESEVLDLDILTRPKSQENNQSQKLV